MYLDTCQTDSRVVVYALDENGNRMHCHHGVIAVDVQGELELIGPRFLSFMGGAAAFWVKTVASGKDGQGSIHITCERTDISDEHLEIACVLPA